MGIVFKNNAKTTLASSLSNSATSATVTDGSVFPSLSAGEFFLITFDDGTNNEICKCTARSGNTLTIVRAQESTTARAFSSGDSAEGRVTAGVLEQIQENIAAKSANQTVFNTTTSGGATTYNIGTNPGVEANAMVFLNGVLQHHDTLSFSGTNLTFDAAPPNGMALEVIIDNLINLQSSNLTVDSFTAADVSGNPQTDFVLSDTPAAETNLIVFVDGVFQDQDAYTISSSTLSITTGVIAGRGVTVYVINPVNIGTPSDSTVTSAKLSGNITMPGTLTVGSNDVAFDSPTFVVDHTNSRVGLGTASPSVPVDIVGDVKMSANLTVDTNTLVVDSSNNRVGVGTASPQAVLHLKGAGNELRFERTNFDPLQVGIGTANSQNGFHLTNITDSTIPFSLHENAPSSTLVIDSSGNIGVGTDNPVSQLHIESSGATQLRIRTTSSSSEPQMIMIDGAGDYFAMQKVDRGMTFKPQGTEVMRVETNAVTFAAPLQIATSTAAEISLTGNGSGNLVAANDLYIMAGNGTSSGNLYFGSDGTNAQVTLDGGQLTTEGITAVGSGNYGSGTVGLISKSVSNRGTIRIRSDADNPAELFFDVNGGIRWDFSTRGSSSSYDLNLYPQGSTPALNAVGGHVFKFTQTGHLGIGTNTSARSGLDVDGAVTSSNSDNDLGTHTYSSYASRVNSGRIDVTAGYSGTMSSGRAFTFRYNATSWKAFHGRITLSATGGFASYEFGGYWNNSGSCSTAEIQDTLQSTLAFTTSGQNILLTLTIGQAAVHPCLSVEYNQSGGDGAPRMDRAAFIIS